LTFFLIPFLSTFKELFDTWKVFCLSKIPEDVSSGHIENASQGDDGLLVSFGAWHLLPIVIQHGSISPVIFTAQSNNLVFPMSLLMHQLVDCIIQISNILVCKAS